MKKITFLVLSLVLVSYVGAQDFKLFMGPVVSNYSSQWPNMIFPEWQGDTSSLNPFDNHRTGIVGGFGVEFTINKKLAVEIDGLYFEKGSVFIFEPTDEVIFFESYKVEYKLRSLSFPIFLKARPFSFPLPYFLAGADVSLNLSHERTSFQMPEAGSVWNAVGQEDLSFVTRNIAMGAVFGIGLEAPLKKGLLSLEARYQLGITNIMMRFGDALRTRSLLLIVGYKI